MPMYNFLPWCEYVITNYLHIECIVYANNYFRSFYYKNINFWLKRILIISVEGDRALKLESSSLPSPSGWNLPIMVLRSMFWFYSACLCDDLKCHSFSVPSCLFPKASSYLGTFFSCSTWEALLPWGTRRTWMPSLTNWSSLTSGTLSTKAQL